MRRSQLQPLPSYFDRYINQCDELELLDAIQISIDELENFPLAKWKLLGSKTYAPGKWTVKQILQHLTDTERIFTYRALAFARGEIQQLNSYDEDAYANASGANERSIEALVAELKTTHLALHSLYQSFNNETLLRKGMGFRGEYSVADIGFILPGHQRWHLKILEEKYYPLNDEGNDNKRSLVK